jgi:hypothetical protein
MTEQNFYANLFKTFFKVEEKENIPSSKSEKKSTTQSMLSDKNFESSIREKISQKLPICKFQDKNLEQGKEFILFFMELFNAKTKELICSNSFFNEEFYHVKNGEDRFFINRKDLSKLCYYDLKTGNHETIMGFEEEQQTKDATKFYFTEKEINNMQNKNSGENEGLFLNEIKFNLISRETISFIGENNNIPEELLDDCYVKGKLLSKGNNLFALCFGKDKEFKIGQGIIHYPAKNYYIKLSTIKGEFDGIYTCKKDFKLLDFHCRKIFSQFDTIAGNSIILFEFKDGKSGEKKIITQAKNYQKNAKVIFKERKFYHIIIIRSKDLGDLVGEKINEELIQTNQFVNFAVLCLDSKLSICDESLIPLQEKPKEETKQPNEGKKNNMELEISKLRTDVKNIDDKLNKLIEELGELRKNISTSQ